ncbi:uncharacterized protein BDZ99DRAFT_210698 [Mytilinidion resinicola]|uniref:Uncharacterized protein n=1 Tax=Mytilinidion resinicola TaxID=574789 RepID=A0A6A6Y037_9PEZI|nr:uncharacterized protein BDZ99DRAFT_210698 [Mytilinidion resinicola]KAF2802171.1 hypothetical protein BDZ99DRAFT_210698 [Mytilinidion resinicola]
MNYSNMIEEKNLKKTFIIATLCSTLVGTFTSSMGLYEAIAKKRQQRKRDSGQDEEIKKLREKVEKADKRDDRERDDSRRRRPSPRGGPRDEFSDSLDRSGAMIQRQYEQGYQQLGRRFAVGDTLTENQLQAQIISLQQTVIHILQDALYNERPLSQSDLQKLKLASQSAREGSLEALRAQQQRLESPTASPAPRALPPPRRAATLIDEPASVFCRYSLDLQYIARKPLSAAFDARGDGRCPDCRALVPIAPDDFWKIGKRSPILVPDGAFEKEVLEEREFRLGQRFIVKCHTEDGEFACVLCNRFRDVDVVCGSVETLVNHVGRAHEVEEFEKEADLRELLLPPLPLPAPLPPVVKERERELVEVRGERRALEYR